MVRGCKKSIIYVKNTGSEYFKEAYFILNEGGGVGVIGERDLVSEAKRIIEERKSFEEKKGIKRVIRKNVLPFSMGLGLGLVAFFIALFI